MLGPLKGDRLRFANMIPGDGGGAVPKAAEFSFALVMVPGPREGAPARTRRRLLGNELDVGVAGRTLMLLCGLFFTCEMCPLTVDTLGDAMEALLVELALLCVWWWCGIDRMLLTDEEVDLRPRRPPEERRYEERGVRGAGEAESRRVEPDPWVVTRGRRGTLCVVGGGWV